MYPVQLYTNLHKTYTHCDKSGTVVISSYNELYDNYIYTSRLICGNISQNTEKQQFRRFDNLRLSSSVNDL